MMKRAAAVSAFLLWSVSHQEAAALTDHANEADEEVMMTDIPIVMTASRIPQSAFRSPVSVTILTRDMIERSGAVEIPELFRMVPGFHVAHSAGSHYVVSYHGQEVNFPTRLEVLVDGRSVYNNLLSNVSWPTVGVALDEIEQIEVIRGPNAPVFGSNSMVATISITTKSPAENHGTWIRATKGSLDTTKIMLRHGGEMADIDYRLTATTNKSDGYRYGPDDGWGHDFDDYDYAVVGLTASYSPSIRDEINISLGATFGDQGSSHPNPDKPFSNASSDIDSSFQHLKWTRITASGNKIETQLTHDHSNRKDRATPRLSTILGVPSAAVPLVTGGMQDQKVTFVYADGVSDRLDAETQYLFSHGRYAGAVGGGVRHDRMKSLEHLGTTDYLTNDSARLFSNNEWAITDKLSLHAGGIIEHNEIVYEHHSWRLAANYKIRPTQSIRFSISKTERSPSILDEYWEFRPIFEDGTMTVPLVDSPTNNISEKLSAARVGYAWMNPEKGVTADISVFAERAKDLISWPDDKSVFEPFLRNGVDTTTNDDRYSITGIEGQLGYDHNGYHLWAHAMLTHSNRIQQNELGGEPYHIDNATAKAIGMISLAKDFPGRLTIGGSIYHMSKTFWIGDGTEVPGYTRADLRIAKKKRLGRGDASIELIGQNIGATHQEYHERNRFEPRYYVRVGYKF